VRIDLHTHSAVSDGTDTPAELVLSAAAAGLDVVALTDHDTVDGWPAAADAAHGAGITLVTGTEISTRSADGHSIHLLAYLFDPDEPELAALLHRIRFDRVPRLQRMVEAVRAQGVDITWERVVERAGVAVAVGRPHLADALVDAGVASSREDAFSRWIGVGSPAYVPKASPPTAEAVRLVRAAGGVPVIAHPWSRGRRGGMSAADVEALVDEGLAGLEVDHVDHADADRAELRGITADLGIIATGSSDYHGTGKTIAYGLGARTTAEEAYEAILAQGRRQPVSGRR
jgi:predicted metal-dependent phosphoesterase TrpH